MGTTVVAVLVTSDRLVFAGVGDSRVYLWAAGKVQQLTEDDSWVATVLAKEPGVDESTLARHPMRHVLTNVVGARDETEVEIGERTLHEGEILLLCSDGLHGTLDDEAMQRIVGGGGEVAELAERLVAAALERNASDNVTALLVRYSSDVPPDPGK
jgi:protein phosphatase